MSYYKVFEWDSKVLFIEQTLGFYSDSPKKQSHVVNLSSTISLPVLVLEILHLLTRLQYCITAYYYQYNHFMVYFLAWVLIIIIIIILPKIYILCTPKSLCILLWKRQDDIMGQHMTTWIYWLTTVCLNVLHCLYEIHLLMSYRNKIIIYFINPEVLDIMYIKI